MIKEVKNLEEAKICDKLLNKLIIDEYSYDKTIDKKFKVKDYFTSIYKDDNNKLLIYKTDDKIVGYIFAKKIEKGILIDGLYVEKTYRNNGIATDLINHVIKISKENKIPYIDINVMYENESAKNLYKKLGFNEFRITLRKGNLYQENSKTNNK